MVPHRFGVIGVLWPHNMHALDCKNCSVSCNFSVLVCHFSFTFIAFCVVYFSYGIRSHCIVRARASGKIDTGRQIKCVESHADIHGVKEMGGEGREAKMNGV